MRRARTKIIATLGPSSSGSAMLRKMIRFGLDVVRLNFSHGTHEEHLSRIRLVRELNKKMRRAVKIMQDLEGYRIRIGKLTRSLTLTKRRYFYLTQEDKIGNEKEVPFDYQGSLRQIKKGALVYVDDGKIVLEVSGVERRRLKVQAVIPGLMKPRKGVNIPGVHLDFEGVTEKDKRDIQIAIHHKLDYVAQSFVRNAGDVKALKQILRVRHPKCRLFSKVENREAIAHIDEIIEASDGIIVARGDLGVCLPIYKVPVIQKEIVKRCRLKGKPVVVATQMLESMTEARLPTRAEVSDVANAVLDGATHLLLSGETAVGRHPHLVIDMMNQVIRSAEGYTQRLKNPSE